jgi:multisubunit Na+/H+ antiporter MnhB subunit
MLALYVLMVLMILAAIIAVEIDDLLSSVVAVGAVGLGLALVCLLLQAPDVAITQLTVEIIALIILIRATIHFRLKPAVTGNRLIPALVAVGFGWALLAIIWNFAGELPAFGTPPMRVSETYLEKGLGETGAANIVSAVLLDYRAYDTLGEATVLFTAALGVLTVTRRSGHETESDSRGTSNE